MHHDLPPTDWDQRLHHMSGGILQSQVWAQFQLELGREIAWDQSDSYQWLAGIRRSKGLSYLMTSYGPVAQNGEDMQEAIKSCVQSAQTLGLDFVRIEPQHHAEHTLLNKLGAHRIADADPAYTRVVDLTLEEDELRAALTSGHRNLINGTERRGITIRQTTTPADFELFLKMLHDTASRSKVTFYSDDYFRAMFKVLSAAGAITMYISEVEGQPVAAAMFYDWNGTRYYAHAGAFQEQNRKLKTSVSLVWQALLDAKEAGFTRFDLWGVAPEGDEAHHLAGLSRFKNGFGGTQVEYTGTWDIPVKAGKYKAYNLYRKLRGRL